MDFLWSIFFFTTLWQNPVINLISHENHNFGDKISSLESYFVVVIADNPINGMYYSHIGYLNYLIKTLVSCKILS